MAIGQDLAPEVPPGGGGIKSLKDFTDINKLANPVNTAGLQTDLAGIGNHFKDLGGSFKDSQNMKNLVASVEQPGATNFTGAYSSLGGLMSEFKGDFDGMTGIGRGAGGIPNMLDFLEPVAGGPAIDAFNTAFNSGETDFSSHLDALEDLVSNSESLFDAAGIDPTETPVPSLSSHMNAATSLAKIGAETNGSGAKDALMGMLDNSVFGDSIKVAMIEGKNNALLAEAGIQPPQFNPFEGYPSYAGQDSSLNSDAAGKLLGGS